MIKTTIYDQVLTNDCFEINMASITVQILNLNQHFFLIINTVCRLEIDTRFFQLRNLLDIITFSVKRN